MAHKDMSLINKDKTRIFHCTYCNGEMARHRDQRGREALLHYMQCVDCGSTGPHTRDYDFEMTDIIPEEKCLRTMYSLMTPLGHIPNMLVCDKCKSTCYGNADHDYQMCPMPHCDGALRFTYSQIYKKKGAIS